MAHKNKTIDDLIISCKTGRDSVVITTRKLGNVVISGDHIARYGDLAIDTMEAAIRYDHAKANLNYTVDNETEITKNLVSERSSSISDKIGVASAVLGGLSGIFLANQLLGAGDKLVYNPLSMPVEAAPILVIADVVGMAFTGGIFYFLSRLVPPQDVPVLGSLIKLGAKMDYNKELKPERREVKNYEQLLLQAATYQRSLAETDQ